MNNISFNGGIKADKSFFALKRTNSQKIFDELQKFADIPKFANLIGEDEFILSGKSTKTRETINISYGEISSKLNSNCEIKFRDVLNEILYCLCCKHEKRPYSRATNRLFQALLK